MSRGFLKKLNFFSKPLEISLTLLYNIRSRKEVNACELIEKAYGKEAFELIRSYLELDQIDREKFMEAISMNSQLDVYDRGSIIERMKILLEQEKYSIQKESSNGKAM